MIRQDKSHDQQPRYAILAESLSDKWSRGSVSIDKIDDNHFRSKIDIKEPDFIEGQFLYIDCMHGSHFGHFIVDVLSMLWAYDWLKMSGIRNLKVCFSQPISQYLLDTLACFGIGKTDIFHIDAPIQFEEVFFATRSFFTQGYTSPFAIETWKKVRNFFDKGEGPRRAYISRRLNASRQLINEDEIENIFKNFGFEVVYPEKLNMSDQVNIWSNAVLIGGTAGSNMYGLAFQKNLKASFIVNSPNFIHLQETFLQAECDSSTDIYLGDPVDTDIHGRWSVSTNNLLSHLRDWLDRNDPNSKFDFAVKRSDDRRIVIKPMGGFANKMIQVMAAHGVQAHAPDARIEHGGLAEWSIEAVGDSRDIGRSVGFGDQVNLLNVAGLGSCLTRGAVDTIVIDSYAQHFDNFPDVETCRRLFRTPPALDHVTGFGADRLVISIRGGEILDGRHPDYILLPPSFYEMVIRESGLKPVFFGQIEDNAYCLTLRARFPQAEFVAGHGVMHDFAVLRRSRHIVPSISTFSWLAAWLSEAESVLMPVAGLFNPQQARAHNFLPLDDPRYRFYLFPLAYSVDIQQHPQRFSAMQRVLDGAARLILADRLRQIVGAAPVVERRLDSFLRFYDEAYYTGAEGDIGAAVRAGHLPSGLHHYIEHGFIEQRACFRLDNFHYATQYPIAAAEVAQGEYLDFAHHFVEVGHMRGYTTS